MFVDLLIAYEARINGVPVRLDRNKNDINTGNLFVNGILKGVVPFYYTVNKMVEFNDKSYPTYEGIIREKLNSQG